MGEWVLQHAYVLIHSSIVHDTVVFGRIDGDHVCHTSTTRPLLLTPGNHTPVQCGAVDVQAGCASD